MKATNKKHIPASAVAPILVVLSALAAPPGFAVDNTLESYLPPSVKAFRDTFNIEFEALLMVDLASARGAYADEESISEASIRRARLGMSSSFNQLSADVSLNVDESLSADSLHKATIAYKFNKALSLEGGLMKQPFGLEGSTSSKHLRTFERSMASDAFTPARGYGIAITHESSAHFASLGFFGGRRETDVQDVSARIVWSPMNDKRQVLHFGASVNQGNYSGLEYQIRNSGNIAVSNNFIRSARYYPDTVQTVSIEGAWSYGSLLIQSEWFAQMLTLVGNQSDTDPVFTGGQVQAAWVFAGGYRRYKGQRFTRMAGTQHHPTIELVAGAGVVDARDADRGDQAWELTLGVNVQMSDQISFSTQLQSVTVQDNNDGEVTGNGLQLRLVAAL